MVQRRTSLSCVWTPRIPHLVHLVVAYPTRPTPVAHPTMSAQQVRATHILIKHKGSRRAASWKVPPCLTLASWLVVLGHGLP